MPREDTYTQREILFKEKRYIIQEIETFHISKFRIKGVNNKLSISAHLKRLCMGVYVRKT